MAEVKGTTRSGEQNESILKKLNASCDYHTVQVNVTNVNTSEQVFNYYY